MPKVSVVVATYRQEESLKKALQSLAEQTYDDFEVILVDDNGVETVITPAYIVINRYLMNYADVVVPTVIDGVPVTEIDADAFHSCPALTSILYQGTERQWSEIAKGDEWNADAYTVTYAYVIKVAE